MNLIERYIFRRIFSLFLMALFATTFIVLTTQVLLFVNVLTQSGQALSAFMKLALTLTPGMIMVVIPFALILGISNTLNRMNNDSELAVLESAGAGRAYMVKPILALAIVLTVISLFLAMIIEPWAGRQRRDLLLNASADLIQIAVQSGSFRQLESKLYVQVADQYPGGDLGGIFLADRREDETELLYYANRGTIIKQDTRNLLLMSDGEIHRRDVASGDVSVITFASYALDMSQYGPANGSSYYLPKERRLSELRNPDPNDWYAKNQPQVLRAEIHRRFSEWLYPLTFAFIAIYFAGTARTNRQERVWSMAAAFTVAFALRGLGFAMTNESGNGLFFASVTYALPIGAMLIIAFLLITGRVIAIPQRLLERLTAVAVAMEARRAALLIRLSGYRRRTQGAA